MKRLARVIRRLTRQIGKPEWRKKRDAGNTAWLHGYYARARNETTAALKRELAA